MVYTPTRGKVKVTSSRHFESAWLMRSGIFKDDREDEQPLRWRLLGLFGTLAISGAQEVDEGRNILERDLSGTDQVLLVALLHFSLGFASAPALDFGTVRRASVFSLQRN